MIFFKLILSFNKKYPINIDNKILVSLKDVTTGIGAFVNAHTAKA